MAIAFVSRFSLSLNWGRLEGARDTEALSIINPKIKENDHQFMKTRGFPYNVIKGPFLHVSLMYTVISTRVNFIYFVVYLYLVVFQLPDYVAMSFGRTQVDSPVESSTQKGLFCSVLNCSLQPDRTRLWTSTLS